MITLSDYIEFDEVRAVLGVSIYELSDDQLELPLFARAVQRRLRSTVGDFGTDTGKDLLYYLEALDGSSTAAGEELFDNIVELMVYLTAEVCLSGLSLTAMNAESDGKNDQKRFNSEKVVFEVQKRIGSKITELMAPILSSLGITNVATAAGFGLSKVEPATDVVTNESA